jgi:predicted nucleotidyltransferase
MVIAYDADRYIPIMVERIVAAFNPVKIVLFGSRARGDAKPDSDVDLLVVLDEMDSAHETGVAIGEVIADLPIPADIVPVTATQIERLGNIAGYIYRPALREGRTIYAR